LFHAHPRASSDCLVACGELSGCGVDEGVHADLDGAVDFFSDLLFPVSSVSLGDAATGPAAEPFSIGYQGATRA
jgi:hypothetical protein